MPDGTVRQGQSGLFPMIPLNSSPVGPADFTHVIPLPLSIQLTSTTATLAARNQTTQLTVTAQESDGTVQNLTAASTGTSYSSSNPEIATVSPDGLVTAVTRGAVILTASNEGQISGLSLTVAIPNDSDGDGMPDDWERLYGLNPNDPSDAGQDPDGDGLTNLQEYLLGTNPRVADTDGDGLTDGQEVKLGTNPLVADTDGDGLSDGLEVAMGTNPRNPDTDGDGIPDGLEVKLGTNPLVADPTTTVQGVVVDSSNKPVSGAAAITLGVFSATSDSTGFFSIPHVPVALGAISVIAQNVVNGQFQSNTSASFSGLGGGVTNVGTIRIAADNGTVTGIVTDVQGRPTPGVAVAVSNGVNVRNANTDITGRYVVSNMVSGVLVVTANDRHTGLRGRATGNLPLNQEATINVMMGSSGSITGTVYKTDALTPVGAGIRVTLNQSSTFTLTDQLGRYFFDFVALGPFSVDAIDAAGNRGRTNATVTNTGTTTQADVTFLGRGTVTGAVRDGAGNGVANASVSINIGGPFGSQQTTSTDGQGAFSFAGVFIGPYTLSAKAPVQRLGAQAAGTLDRDGQTVTTNLMLTAAGSIAGTVFRADGVTAVPGAVVTLSSSGQTATADSQGRYRFDFLPVASYSVDATDPQTSDRGRNTGSVTGQDQVQTVNVKLNGQGQVTVTVLDGSGTLVPGAQVTLTTTTPFSSSQILTTGPAGTVQFPRVLAGSFNAMALNPVTRLGGQGTGSVAANGNATLTVQLQATGSISGTVFGSDGVTPVSILVSINGLANTVTSGTNGAFRFDGIPTGTYTVRAVDQDGNTRAQSGNVTVSSQGQVANTTLTLVGTGTVVGHVSMPDGSPAQNAAVTLQSQYPGFVQRFTAFTDLNGNYGLSGVPVGGFAVSVSLQAAGQSNYAGSGSGQLTSNGGTAVLNITLVFNTQTLGGPGGATVTLYDASDFNFDLSSDGSIASGNTQFFGGDFATSRGGVLLDITPVSTGVPVHFTGSSNATTDQGGRQLAIQQSNLAGLNVTRKIYVPRTGYFARYVEFLKNPGTSPITVGVRSTTNIRFIRKVRDGFLDDVDPRIVRTSKGDAVLTVGTSDPDRWVMIDDDDDSDPFVSNATLSGRQLINGVYNTLPQVVEVFDGPNAALAAARAGFASDFSNRFSQFFQQWDNITIPAGGTAAIMHFVVQQTSRAAAGASGDRLLTLPPEALVGLSTAELAQIRNFSPPSNGVSSVQPLPDLNGQISGRVLAADGTTPIPSAQVNYQSQHPLFGRTFTVPSDGTGNYQVVSVFNDLGSSLPVPLTSFTLQATNPVSGLQTPLLVAGFQGGSQNVTQNLIFSNAGEISGLVHRSSGLVLSVGQVQLNGPALLNPLTVNIGQDGSFGFTALPPGNYLLIATIPNPQGTALTGSASVVVSAGIRVPADIVIQTTGTVTGMLRHANGDLAVGKGVLLRAANASYSAQTDTGGRFSFLDVPTGLLTLSVVDSTTNESASAAVTVLTDQVTTQNLTLTSGTILSVTPNSGKIGQTITLNIAAANTNFVQGSTTADFGPGIVVTSLTVNSPTTATARITINTSAALGSHVVSLSTSGLTASLASGFLVQPPPAILSLTPPNGQQGASIPVTIVGQLTSFAQGTTSVTFGAGIQVGSVTVNNPLSATAAISIDPTTAAGPRTVTVTTGTEVVTSTFTVSAGNAVISSVAPSAGQAGQRLTVNVTSQNTHFAQGVTSANFGAGITVNSVAVSTATSAAADITIASTAAIGSRAVTLTTGSEVATLASGFNVGLGSPTVTKVTPATGLQGQTLSVAVTGVFTNFVQGTTTADFGAGVTTNSVTVSSATSASASITISPTASAGLRKVTLTTGTEIASLVDGWDPLESTCRHASLSIL